MRDYVVTTKTISDIMIFVFMGLSGMLSTARRGWWRGKRILPHRAGSITTRTLRPKARSG